MYISVIPTSKSLGKHPSTYFVSEMWKDQVEVGGLVEIPLRKDLITGIIAGLSDTSPEGIAIEDIRPIHQIISTTPLITREMIDAVLLMADRYFLLIHKSLALFLPTPLMSRLEKRHYVLDTGSIKTEALKAKYKNIHIHHYVEMIFSPTHLDGYLFEDTVIVFPDDMMLSVFMESQIKKRDDILILRNEATPTKRSQAWIDIYEKKYSIIVGTRRILYYNLQAYKNIIYIEDAFGKEHYQYPISIRSLDILHALHKGNMHDITVATSTPTLELFATFPKEALISKK